MLDIQSIREEAFQHLPKMPHFCSDVIVLIEELETARSMLSVKDRLLDDDAMIIGGLVDHYKIMEKVTIAARKLADGKVTLKEFEKVWLDFSKTLKVSVPL